MKCPNVSPMDSKGSGGVKKYGRNATPCKRYKLSGRRERNKVRNAARYKKHMADAARRTQYTTSAMKAKRRRASQRRKRRVALSPNG